MASVLSDSLTVLGEIMGLFRRAAEMASRVSRVFGLDYWVCWTSRSCTTLIAHLSKSFRPARLLLLFGVGTSQLSHVSRTGQNDRCGSGGSSRLFDWLILFTTPNPHYRPDWGDQLAARGRARRRLLGAEQEPP